LHSGDYGGDDELNKGNPLIPVEIFWIVTPCSVAIGFNILEVLAASIFKVK
jgi:hypothetical protein